MEHESRFACSARRSRRSTLGYVPASNAALLFENYTPRAVGAPGSLAGIWGTEFTVGDQSLNVTKLGTFAVASSDMSVGIWRVSDQTLVGSVDVPSIGGIAMQGWNFANVTPFTLLANTVYRIGAETESLTVAWGNNYQRGNGIASVTPGHVRSDLNYFDFPVQPANAILSGRQRRDRAHTGTFQRRAAPRRPRGPLVRTPPRVIDSVARGSGDSVPGARALVACGAATHRHVATKEIVSSP